MAGKIFGLGMVPFAILLIVVFTQQDKIKKMLRRG